MSSESLAAYLRSLDAHEIAVHLTAMPEREMVIEACRIAGKRIVSIEEHPRVVVTADGAFDEGVVRPLKDEVDAVVPIAERVIVFRHVGDAALAPTMDAYLDVTMIDGRDVWFDQVGASG